LTEPARELEAVHIRHHHVGKDQIWAPLLGCLQGLNTVIGHPDFVAGGFQFDLEEPCDEGIVIHDEQALASAYGAVLDIRFFTRH
jgi:hypothetical protein